MRIGELRHRVTIQDKTVTQNAYGEEEITWTDVATVWAAVEPLSGQEFLAAEQIQADIDVRVRVRYRSDINLAPEMRLVWGSHVYDIQYVADIRGRHREWHVYCTEAV